jgi:hypothetical protein
MVGRHTAKCIHAFILFNVAKAEMRCLETASLSFAGVNSLVTRRPPILRSAIPWQPDSYYCRSVVKCRYPLSAISSGNEKLSRRTVIGVATTLLFPLLPCSNSYAFTNPLEGFTDACELDSCIFRDRREFQRVGRKFVIKQEFDKNGSKSTGSAVWEGDVVLTKFMDQEIPRDYWKGKNIVELGAGTGLAGMVASALGAAQVHITDGDNKVLDLAKRNVEANLSPQERAHVDISQLRWESVSVSSRSNCIA